MAVRPGAPPCVPLPIGEHDVALLQPKHEPKREPPRAGAAARVGYTDKGEGPPGASPDRRSEARKVYTVATA
jgi:hypothetical protein